MAVVLRDIVCEYYVRVEIVLSEGAAVEANMAPVFM